MERKRKETAINRTRPWIGFDLLEIKKGHFVKVVDGEIIGPASKGEIKIFQVSKKRAQVDPAMVEISLALTALLGVFFAQPDLSTVFRAFIGVVFFLSFLASLYFYTAYVTLRLPLTLTRYYHSKFARTMMNLRIPGNFWIWVLLWHYPKQFVRVSFFPKGMSFDEQTTEFGYLTLFMSLFLGSVLLSLYVILYLY